MPSKIALFVCSCFLATASSKSTSVCAYVSNKSLFTCSCAFSYNAAISFAILAAIVVSLTIQSAISFNISKDESAQPITAAISSVILS